MEQNIGLIGFGEAGTTFAQAGAWGGSACIFDIKLLESEGQERFLDDCQAIGVSVASSLAEAVSGRRLVLSLVTADQAYAVAEAVAAYLAPETLYCDMNSVAPQTKRASAELIEAADGHYIDIAVMAPVRSAALDVPLLLSGPQAQSAHGALSSLGFSDLRVVGTEVGRASSIKMIRSVMVKGLEALSAECVLAAHRAGVLEDVLSSLDASEKRAPWMERADYNLDRMLVHGVRRAAEMEEVARTLDDLGVDAAMTRGTIRRQRQAGNLKVGMPPGKLEAKIDMIQSKTEGRGEPA